VSGESLQEREVLARLSCFRSLNTYQLEEFVLDRPGLTRHAREVAMQRILERLRKRGLVAATRRLVGGPGGGSARLAYALTEAGYRRATALDPALRRHRPPPRTTLFIEHALMAADVALAFLRTARSHPGHDLSAWESDREAAECLGPSHVVPDGRLVYATGDWEVSAFVEIDLATEQPSRFAEKVREYLDACASGSWRARLPAWPLVLTITPSGIRATALRRATEDLLRVEGCLPDSAHPIEFEFAALPDLEGPNGPLGEIWQVAGRIGAHALIPAKRAELVAAAEELGESGSAPSE
jgi:hypothetical protein